MMEEKRRHVGGKVEACWRNRGGKEEACWRNRGGKEDACQLACKREILLMLRDVLFT